MPSPLQIKQINYDSIEYKQALRLRDLVLRQPIGMSIYEDNLTGDISDIHIAASLDEEIVGTLILHPLSEKEMKMRQVAVNQARKGEGIGAKMVAFSEKMAINSGCKKMVLNARKVVVPFYQKLGYATVGEEFLEVGIPHFKMFKILN